MKTMAALQDDVARHGPWEYRMTPFKVRNIIVVKVVRHWASLSNPNRREYGTQCVIYDTKKQCSFVWSLVIGVAIRAFITWILKKYETDPMYWNAVKHVRKIQGGRYG
tara:strand:+ start:78 stop:401 length:324 start_codon:yes stop_codon:yes gene_type:complete